MYDLTCSQNARSSFFSFFGNNNYSQNVGYTVTPVNPTATVTIQSNPIVANVFNQLGLQTAINNMIQDKLSIRSRYKKI